MDSSSVALEFLAMTREQFLYQKSLADRSFAQLSDEEFLRGTAASGDSIAIIAKHVGSNLRSRWEDFLTTDGEKPDRNRDGEFVLGEGEGRQAVMEWWNRGWATLMGTLESLSEEDLGKTVTIRSEPHTVPKALQRSLAHTAYHMGQIVHLSRMIRGDEWMTLSIPLGGSTAFNTDMAERHPSST